MLARFLLNFNNYIILQQRHDVSSQVQKEELRRHKGTQL